MGRIMITKKAVFFICIVVAVTAFWVGSEYTKYQELNWCVEQAIKMLNIQGYKVELNTGLITAGLMKYQDRFEKFINITFTNGTFSRNEI